MTRAKEEQAAAYGGPGWSRRTARHRDEIGAVWAACGVDSEWAPLRAVLLHRPGVELAASAEPDAVQMLAPLDLGLARDQHDALAAAYLQAGVEVHYVDPAGPALPNQMFVADLMFMTPEGALLARPASTVRAGEERQVARRLADLGLPILATLGRDAVFEGADAAWLDPKTVLIGQGLRTNGEAVAQIGAILNRQDVALAAVGLPAGAMHLMGLLRFLDRDLAVAWPGRIPEAAVAALGERGYRVLFLPDPAEARRGQALNFVTLGPRKVLMPAGNPAMQGLLEENGVECATVAIDELINAAGGIGCLTGILRRDPIRPQD